MKVNAKKMIADLKISQNDKKRISLYLSEGMYLAFKKNCELQDVSPSEVVERLMGSFLESLGKKVK